MKQSVYYGLLLLAVCLGGCGGGDDGPKTFTVSGQVTFGGQPVENGEIVFRPAEGGGRSDAGRISAGKYSFQSTLGPKKVEIRARREVEGSSKKLESGESGPELEQFIPEKYNDKTTLNADVTDSGDNKFDFPLEDK